MSHVGDVSGRGVSKCAKLLTPWQTTPRRGGRPQPPANWQPLRIGVPRARVGVCLVCVVVVGGGAPSLVRRSSTAGSRQRIHTCWHRSRACERAPHFPSHEPRATLSYDLMATALNKRLLHTYFFILGSAQGASTSNDICALALLKQQSKRRACVHGSSFGCELTKSPDDSAVMYVRYGCRGRFLCGGNTVRCGSFTAGPVAGKLFCPCSPPLPKTDNSTASFKYESSRTDGDSELARAVRNATHAIINATRADERPADSARGENSESKASIMTRLESRLEYWISRTKATAARAERAAERAEWFAQWAALAHGQTGGRRRSAREPLPAEDGRSLRFRRIESVKQRFVRAAASTTARRAATGLPPPQITLIDVGANDGGE